MCTAISTNGFFGRTLDIECSYNEQIVVTPRNFALEFLYEGTSNTHPAIIGVATVQSGMPLYYDAINEHGLGVAGLNFPISAVYNRKRKDAYNVASYELIPFILSNCRSVAEAKNLLKNINVTADSFSDQLKATPLHWIVADSDFSIVVEPTREGLKVYDNDVGVLTNEPQFSYHVTHLCDFLQLGAKNKQNSFCKFKTLLPYSRGMGALGLPGDYSSSSRFVRALFAKEHTELYSDGINRFFHIMDTVTVPYGCVKTDSGKNSFTVYTSCADLKEKSYHYTTYDCRSVRSLRLTPELSKTERLFTIEMHGANGI